MGRESTNAWYKSSNTFWINTGKDHLASICDQDMNMSIPYYYHFITSYSGTAKWMEIDVEWESEGTLSLLSTTSVDSSQPSVSRVKRANSRNCPLLPCTWTWPCTWRAKPQAFILASLPFPSSLLLNLLLQQAAVLTTPSTSLCTTNFYQEVCKYLILKTALFLCCFCFVKGYFYSLHLQHIIHSSSFCLEGKGYLYLILDITVSLYTVHICTNKLIKC